MKWMEKACDEDEGDDDDGAVVRMTVDEVPCGQVGCLHEVEEGDSEPDCAEHQHQVEQEDFTLAGQIVIDDGGSPGPGTSGCSYS